VGEPAGRRDPSRRRAFNEIDWDNVAEEIEDVRKRYEQEIRKRLRTACVHLLKLTFQPELASNSWRSAVVRSRVEIAGLKEDMPTLRPYPAEVLARAYKDARPIASAETGLEDFPEGCPWTIGQVLDLDFWP
jgi:hypothetical protein